MGACALVALVDLSCAEGLGRPELAGAKPQAVCGLQVLQAAPRREMPAGVVFTSAMEVADDPLSNYARTPLGDWQMPTEVNRANPWLRFVLFAVERPVVIDVAVFVNGKPYADGREAWIEGVLAEARAAKDGKAKGKPSAKPASGEVNVEKEMKTESKPVVAIVGEKKTGSEKKTEGETERTKEIVAKVAEAPVVPKVSAQARQAPDMRERLLTYVSTPGPAADVREIRWLIAEWGFGPPVVVLDASRSWQRAGIAPLLATLDRDRSGALEAAEIAGAEEAFRRADANSDGVVEEQEITRQANEPPKLPFAADHPLVVAIDSATDRDALAEELKRVYRLDAAQVDAVCDGGADVSLRVDFGDAKPHASGVQVLGTREGITATATANVIALDLGGAYVEFAAAGVPAAGADVAGTQVAVGAAIDGHPFLRLLDADHNFRLTQRERVQFAGLVKSLDRDHDGALAAGELPIPIRFAVTLGPQVHTLLAAPAAAARTFAPLDEVAPPDWFASMDQNQDRDLSRSEFLGTAEQFAQFDADADGLLSVAEAKKMEVE